MQGSRKTNPLSQMVPWLMLAAFMHSTPSSEAQWVQTNGPSGGNVQAISAIEVGPAASVVYISVYGQDAYPTEAGIFRSTDLGVSWTDITNGGGILPMALATVADNEGHTYVFGGGWQSYWGLATEIYRFSEEDPTWVKTNGWGFNGFVEFPGGPQGKLLFAGGLNGLYRSTDFGATWTEQVITTRVGPRISALTTMTDQSGRLTLYAAILQSEIWKSVDTGATWTLARNIGIPTHAVRAFAVCGSRLFIATGDDPTIGNGGEGIFVSMDDAGHWTPVNNGLTSLNIYSLAVCPGTSGDTTLIAGTRGSGMFRSTDFGAHWTAITRGVPNSRVENIAVVGSSLFAGTYGAGVIRSTDQGSTWTALNSSPFRATPLAITSLPNRTTQRPDLFATFQGNGLFRSTDQGLTWNLTNLQVNAGPLAVSNAGNDSCTLFAAVPNYALFRSVDYGANWNVVTGVYAGATALAAYDTNVFIGRNGDFFRSTDNGWTWEYSMITSLGSILSFAMDQGYLFAGTEGGDAIYRSTNLGTTWTSASHHFQGGSVRALLMYPGESGAADVYAGGTDGIYRSTDWGDSWDPANTGIGPSSSYDKPVCGLVRFDSTLFAGIFGKGVFFSTDRGANWTDANTNLTNLDVCALFVAGDYLYAGTTGGGIWRRLVANITSVEGEAVTAVPSEFRLEQNYPNPFNPSTTLRYSLPQAAHVTLVIYSTLGQKVADLVNGDVEEGHHGARWEAAGLASGIYFARLTVVKNHGQVLCNQTAKLVLMR